MTNLYIYIYICIRATWAFKVICGSLASLKNKWGKCCPGKPQDTNPKSKNTVNYVQCCVVLMKLCVLSLSLCFQFIFLWLFFGGLAQVINCCNALNSKKQH